jgi:hypothetical protein
MITSRTSGILLLALAGILSRSDVCGRDILFRKTPQDFGETGEVGRAYTRELGRRMFTHASWQQRLYCHSDDDDTDETLEVYSTPGGSRQLSWRHVSPSISRELNRRYFVHEQFDLAKSLASLRITGRDILLPQNVANEIEALWQVMVPGLLREPQTNERVIVIRAPSFVSFRRTSGGVLAGRIVDLAYGSPAYRGFVDIVDELIDSCRTPGGKRNLLHARLPSKMQKLRARLSESSNQAMQRTAR